METDEEPVLSGPGTDSSTKVCALCGRFGARGFVLKAWNELDGVPEYGPIGLEMYVVCTKESSCRKRRGEPEDREEDPWVTIWA